jgi:hypothetical protein
MPIDRRIDESSGVLWTTIRGPVTEDDIHQHLEAVSAMQGHRYYEIIDTRAALPKFGARELPELASHGRRLFGRVPMAPRAVVVNPDDLVYFGVARLFAILAMPWVTVRVFDNVPAARAYIEAIVAANA